MAKKLPQTDFDENTEMSSLIDNPVTPLEVPSNPQTEINNAEMPAAAPGEALDSGLDTADSQTDFEQEDIDSGSTWTQELTASILDALQTEPEASPDELEPAAEPGTSASRFRMSQTDSESANSADGILEDGCEGASKSIPSQTGLDDIGSNPDMHDPEGAQLAEMAAAQTDLESAQGELDAGPAELDEPGPAGKKPRSKAQKTAGTKTEKKPTKRTTSSANDQDPSQKIVQKQQVWGESGETEENPASPGSRETPAGAKAASGIKKVPAAAVKPPSQPRPALKRSAGEADIVPIDAERSVETSHDKQQSDLLDLVESMRSKRILTGTIEGIEHGDRQSPFDFGIIYHGDYKIMIPADQVMPVPETTRKRSPENVVNDMLAKRMDAEVDYIVKGVDTNLKLAGASRLEAMAAKRKAYYFGSDRDGNNLLYDGVCAEARIVSVIQPGIFVDVFGVECYIALRELSYQRWMDASEHFQSGQRVLVKLLAIDRSDRSDIKVQASVKRAAENPYEKAMRRYTVGCCYVGTVSLVDTNGVYVSLEGGIDCLCSYPARGRPPRGSRVTIRVLGINHRTNRVWGVITHMTTAR